MFSNFSRTVVRSSQPPFVRHRIVRCFHASSIPSIGSSTGEDEKDTTLPLANPSKNTIRLSKLLSHDATNVTLSRRQAERRIRDGEVTLAGKVVQTPQLLVDFDEIMANSLENRPLIKLSGKPLLFNPAFTSTSSDEKHSALLPKIWAVHKIKGEVVSENDPHGRPSLLERLKRSGVGRIKQAGKRKQQQLHLKPIGRLDIPSEGLILVTNDGTFAREMELPSSKIRREYRVRVHGKLTSYKLDRIRKGGIEYENVRYPAMKVAVEKPRRSRANSSNTWLRGVSLYVCSGYVFATSVAMLRVLNVYKTFSFLLCSLCPTNTYQSHAPKEKTDKFETFLVHWAVRGKLINIDIAIGAAKFRLTKRFVFHSFFNCCDHLMQCP